MKRLALLTLLAASVLAEENLTTPLPPYSPEARSGKELYSPIRKAVDVEAEQRIQQEGGHPGAKNIPMHSYGSVKGENHSEGGHR